jgi:hypothetical protein
MPARTLLLRRWVLHLGALPLLATHCLASPAAGRAYLQLSAGSTIVRGETPALDLSYVAPIDGLARTSWQFGMLWIGDSRFNHQPTGHNLLWRALIVHYFGNFDVGGGLSYMLNPPPYNGSRVNASLQLEYRCCSVPLTVTYAHQSNAGIRNPNYGRDVLFIGWRF